MFKATSYRKVECAHVSEVSRAACPLCNLLKPRKVRKSKFMMLKGQKIEAPQSYAEVRKIAKTLLGRRPNRNTTGMIRSTK